MGLTVSFDDVKLPDSLIWTTDEDGNRQATYTATKMAVECLDVGMPYLNADNAGQFFSRSVQLALARGCGPWVLEKGKPIWTTYITWQQVRSFAGLKTNAPALTDEQFAAKLVDELRKKAHHVVGRCMATPAWRVTLSLTRVKPKSDLLRGDREAFGKRFKGKTRHVDVDVDLVEYDLDRIKREAVDKFWADGLGGQIRRREDFQLVVIGVKRLEPEL